MTSEFTSAMRRASDLVRAGNPAAATALIQSALGTGQAPVMSARHPGQNSPAPKSRKAGKSLRETLAQMTANKKVHNPMGGAGVAPIVPEGARFDSATFANASGSREYRVYIPKLQGKQPSGIVMMLHGCTQSPADFATGTGMNRVAETHGLIVVYPGQSRDANMQLCWNWFSPADQHHGAGEPAILAGLAEHLKDQYDVATGRTFVAGLSAGAAMAVILGHTYPDVFAAVGAHSGLPYKSAHDVPSAFAAMGGTGTGGALSSGPSVPTIVFHGTTDNTVNPANGQRIADNARASGVELLDDGTTNGRRYKRTTVLSGTAPALEHWVIDGLAHAWSGGNASGSYADPAGPDASAEMVRFFFETHGKGE